MLTIHCRQFTLLFRDKIRNKRLKLKPREALAKGKSPVLSVATTFMITLNSVTVLTLVFFVEEAIALLTVLSIPAFESKRSRIGCVLVML